MTFSIAALLAIAPAQAADFTVANGQTVGQQSLTIPGDVGTIDAGGTINAAGDGVIDVGTVNDLTVLNNGQIIATSDGIDIDGDNATITNNGSIRSTQQGLELDDGNTVVNTGSITSTSADGIVADDNNSITNTGTITSGPSTTEDDGINVDNDNVIFNSGTIIGSDEGVEFDNRNVLTNIGLITSRGGEAVEANDDNSITNSGTIRNTGNDDGIRIDDRNTIVNSGLIESSRRDGIDGDNRNTVTNSGTIRGGSGPGDHGIDLDNRSTVINSGLIEGREGVELNSGNGPNGSSITNSGTIRSTRGPAGTAIRFRGNNRPDTLTLQPGSIIEGRIRLGGGVDTLNVENGLSIAKTFGGGPEIINTNGAPFVQVGNQVVVVDPTLLAAHVEILSDLTSGIFNSIHARLQGAGSGSATGPGAFALGGSSLLRLGARSNLGHNAGKGGASKDNRLGLWSQAFGGLRSQDAESPTTATDHKTVGSLVGVDGVLFSNVRVGVFAGAARSNVDNSLDTQEMETDAFFGGAYASVRQSNWFAHFMLTAGRNNYDSSREVANNTVVGGLETATADFDGVFVSSELTAGVVLRVGGFVIEPSARVRYAHLSIDGYSESGSAGALTTSDQDVSLWMGRLQLAFPMEAAHARVVPRIGIEATSSDNDDVTGLLLGQAVSFDPGGSDDTVTGFVGVTATGRINDATFVFLDTEAHFTDDGNQRAEARAGVTIKY